YIYIYIIALDTESREKYILRTVSSSKSCGNSDFRVGSRRAKKSKTSFKSKIIVEKENAAKILKSSNQNYIERGTSHIIPEEPNIERQAETLTSIPDTYIPISTHQTTTAPVAANQITQYGSQYPSIEFVSNINNLNTESLNNSKSITSNNEINENSSLTNISENTFQYATTVLQAPAYVLNLPNTYSNNVGVCSNQISITKGNNIIEFIPTTQYIYTEGGGSEIYNVPVNSSNIVNENVDSQSQLPERVEVTKNMETEIIDINIEEPVKLEVLRSLEEPMTECYSTVSHDHGYVGNETNVQVNDPEPIKEEKVDDELMALWDDITGGSGLIEFNSSTTPSSVSKESDARGLLQGVSYVSKIESRQNSSEKKRKKARLKGRGKFIGQSKSERERALNFIEKIKSQPNIQLENLECDICDPPRVFTAAATLLSHYKSHAGIRPYVCVFCGSVFTRQHSLNYHYLIHLNQTRFTCVDCGRKFRHPSHFKEHRRRHTGESPFECTDCFMRFKTRNTYKRHLRTRHGKKLTTQGSVHTICEEKNTNSDTNGEQFFTQNISLGSQSSGHALESFNVVNDNSVSSSEQKEMSENISSSTYERGVTVFDSAVNKNLPFQKLSNNEETDMNPFLVCDMLPIQVKYSSASIESNVSLTFSSVDKECNKVSEVLTCSNVSEKPAKLFITSEKPRDNFSGNDKKKEFSYVLKKTNSNNIVDCDSNLKYSRNNIVNNSSELHNTKHLKTCETSVSLKKIEKEPVVGKNFGTYVVNNDNTNAVAVSDGERYDEMKSVMSGSILGALLTSGTSGVHRGYSISSQPKHISEVTLEEQKTMYVNDCVKKTDKWDSLMREVVSLSTMVKEKTEPKMDYPTYDNDTPNSSEVVKEFDSNGISYDRPRVTDVRSEVYVLKYANESSGTRFAKIFKSNPSSMIKETTEIRKENTNIILETPILIKSSVGSWEDRRN
ncbi:Zinc finger Y-chromosomal protein, partial [Armadillidium nasatum]